MATMKVRILNPGAAATVGIPYGDETATVELRVGNWLVAAGYAEAIEPEGMEAPKQSVTPKSTRKPKASDE